MRAIAAELDEALAALREIRDELRGLRADLHLLAAGNARGATTSDDAALGDLLAAIHGAIADRVFSAGDLLIHAALPIATDLHAAILATIGVANARKLGKALARIEGRDLAGCKVVRVASDSTGILWSVRRV